MGSVTGKPSEFAPSAHGIHVTGDNSFTSYNTTAVDCNNAVSNGHWYWNTNGPSTTIGADYTDGALYTTAYSDIWVTQISQGFRNGRLFTRAKNSGTWTNWEALVYQTDAPTTYKAVTSLSSIPIANKFVKATISANGSLSLSGTMAAGRDIHILVYNSGSAAITVSLPTASPYVNLTDDAISVSAKGYAEINIISDGTSMYIRSVA